MRILVTGSSGRVGRALRARLDGEPGYHPIYLTSLHAGRTFPNDGAIDLTDKDALRSAIVSARPDAIVHLASILGSACDTNLERTQQVNIDVVETIAGIAAELGTSRIVFSSSSALYGDSYSAPAKEKGPIDLRTNYASSKFEAEKILSRAANTAGGTQAVSLRIFNVFGANFADSLVFRLKHSTPENPVALRGLDSFLRDYIHVEDVITAITKSLQAKLPDSYTAINIGSGVAVSNRTLVQRLSAQQPVHFIVTEGTPSYSCADTSLARDLLGFSASNRL